MKNPPKTNLIDKIISFFSPVAGVRRIGARFAMAYYESYTGASSSRRSMYDLSTNSQSADDTLAYSRQQLNERGHHLYRNNPIVKGAIDSNGLSIVGSGLQMHSRIDGKFLGINDDQREELETSFEREWNLFSNSSECDVARTSNFGELTNITLRQSYITGESFTILPFLMRPGFPYGLKVQIIEPERICSKDNRTNGILENGNYLYDGIEKDNFGAPLRYHVAAQFPGSLHGQSQTWSVLDAFNGPYGHRNVLHHYHVLRPDQTRGVSCLAPVIEKLHTLDKYNKANLDAALVQALFTVFIKHEKGGGGTPGLQQFKPNSETGAKSSDKDYKLGSGAILDLQPGDDIINSSPGIPNQNYDPFTTAVLREIGMGLNIPIEVLMKHFQSSFTAAKAAFNEAWRLYKVHRSWIVSTFCQPIYERFLFEVVARGRVKAPGFFEDSIVRQAYCGAEWAGPAQGHLNPLQEVQAARSRIDGGITTTEYETAEYNGGKFDQNITQSAREIQLKKNAGLPISSVPAQAGA
jgi:lambda family phage portal protein